MTNYIPGIELRGVDIGTWTPGFPLPSEAPAQSSRTGRSSRCYGEPDGNATYYRNARLRLRGANGMRPICWSLTLSSARGPCNDSNFNMPGREAASEPSLDDGLEFRS